MLVRIYVANGQAHLSEPHAYDICGDLYPPDAKPGTSLVVPVAKVEGLQQVLDAAGLVVRCKKCLTRARMNHVINKAQPLPSEAEISESALAPSSFSEHIDDDRDVIKEA